MTHESKILGQLSDQNETTYFLFVDQSVWDQSQILLKKLNDTYCLTAPKNFDNMKGAN